MQYSKTKIFFRLLAIWVLVVTYGLLITLSSKKETTKLGNAFAIAILLIINYLVSSSICLYIINSKRAHAIKIA